MKAMFLFFMVFSCLLGRSFANDDLVVESSPQAGNTVREIVIGRQYGVHNYLWLPASDGENNSTYQDIAFQFGQSIGAKVTYRYFAHRDELLFALYKGKVDMAMGYAKTQEASSYFSYTQPIYNLSLIHI